MNLLSQIEKPRGNLFKNRHALTSHYLLRDEEDVDRDREIARIANYIKWGNILKYFPFHGSSGS